MQIAALSFRLDEDEAEDDDDFECKPTSGDADDSRFSGSEDSMDGQEPVLKKKKITKNPDVDTSFLPDREREEEERRLREELRQVRISSSKYFNYPGILFQFSFCSLANILV